MSNDSNITEFPSPAQVAPAITLDSVVKAMEVWRSNKKCVQEQIPEAIWQQIIPLLNRFSEATLRSALGLTTAQFRRRLEEPVDAITAHKPLAETPPHIDFCEAKEIKTPQTPSLYKPSRIPATNTLVVEFCRADGRLMKIHTTTDSFAELMKAFFAGE